MLKNNINDNICSKRKKEELISKSYAVYNTYYM